MRRLLVAVGFLLVPTLVVAQGTLPPASPEDSGNPGSGQIEAITPIACPGTVLTEVDFDLMPAGPTTVGDIQATFPNVGILDIELTSPTSPFDPGTYDTNPSGRALAADPTVGVLDLWLIDVGQAFGAFNEMIIDLDGPNSEFGFQVADWNGPANVFLFDQGAPVGNGQFDVAGAVPVCFESDVPFDQVVLTLNPDNPNGNWVVPTLWVGPTQVPTVPTWALGLLVVALAAVSLVAIRRILV